MVKFKDTQFYVKNLKIKRKKNKNFLTFQSRDLNPRFSVIFPLWFEFSWKVRSPRSNQKEIGLYHQIWLLRLFGKYMDGPQIYFITNDLAFLCHLNYCWAKTKKWHFSYDFFRVPTMIPNPLDDMWIGFFCFNAL